MKLIHKSDPKKNRGGTSLLLVSAIVVFVVALIGVFVLTGSVSTTESTGVDDLHMVDRGDFTVSFPASGVRKPSSSPTRASKEP